MNEKRKETLDRYLKYVRELYENIESWVSSSKLKTVLEKVEITEEASGVYEATKLTILDEKKATIAHIMPIGAWVIGANGRVDLIGKYDKVIIVNLEKGASSLTTVIVEDHNEILSTKFYKGVKETGWHWMEDRRRGKAHVLNKELFYELLTEVSDYEF